MEWATIIGTNLNHTVIDRSESYEIFFDSATDLAAPRQSMGGNPRDYVWEYVPACKDRDDCVVGQEPVFYLRSCPRGTQMINASAGALRTFQHVSQVSYLSCEQRESAQI